MQSKIVPSHRRSFSAAMRPGTHDFHVERWDSLFETIASIVEDRLISSQDRYGMVRVKCGATGKRYGE